MEYAAPARTERDVTGLLDTAGHALPNRLAAAPGRGRPAGRRRHAGGGDPLLGFADVWLAGAEPATASLHLAPHTMTAGRIADAVDELFRIAPRATVAALLQQAPARLRRLPGLPVTGDEDGSRYPAAVHRQDLDLAAVAPDGSFAAVALGRLDTWSRSPGRSPRSRPAAGRVSGSRPGWWRRSR